MKKLITFFLLSFLVTTGVWAVTTQVSTAAEFNTAWGDVNCDVIEMASGTYTISASKSITRTITVKASASAVTKPIIVGAQFTMGGSFSISFDGIEAYYDAEGAVTPTGAYFLQATGGVYTIPTISITNCKIHGYGRSLIRADNTTNYPTISTLTVDNCFVYDMGRNNAGYSVFALKAARITTANITNSTFYSCMNGLWYEEVTVTPTTFNMEKCTLYKVSSSGSQLLISNNGGANPSSYTIKDCIISDSYDASTTKMQIKFGSNNGTNKGYLLNSVLATNFATPKFTSTTLTTNTEVATTGITFTCNSPYTDLKVATIPNTITGIGDPRWSLNPVVVLPQETLYTSVNIAGAGTVSKNPNAPTYDRNSTVDITATKNFGYAFVNWIDSVSGSVLSSANPYTVTMNETKHIKAVFAAVNTYKLTVNVVGGAESYQVSASPAATVVNGNNMYEDGTVVTLTATGNPIMTFANWSDNSTNSTLQFTMNQDQSTTATFSASDFIVGWDFYRTGNGNRAAEFYSTSDNSTSALIIRTAAGTTSSWLDKSVLSGSTYYNRGAAVNWNAFANDYYYQTSFVATDFTNISVRAGMLYNYNAKSVQKLEYSLDGTNFTTVDTYTMIAAQTWYDKTIALPADCNHAARVYVRWIPDYTSSTVGAASANDGTSISAIYITGTQAAANDGLAPVLSSSIPVSNGTGASATGKVVLNFNKNVVIANGTTASLGSKTLSPSVAGKTITFNYSGLNYNTAYTFTLPAGTVSDAFGNTLASAVTFSFTTMNRPVVTKKTFDFVVGVDGNFADALSAANTASSSGNRFYIFFPNGEYNIGSLTGDANQMTTIATPKVSYVGQSSTGVILYNQNTTEGINVTATLNFTSAANELYLQDLILKNKDYRSGVASLGRCVVLRDQGNKNIYKNVKLLSNQDTYYTGGSIRSYLEDCEIHGTVDFICGGGDIFFNECNLYLEDRTGNCITAPSTTTSKGYVFSNCTIDGYASTNGNYYLGRPWNNSPRAVYINTVMSVLPAVAGWTEMGVVPALFAEYNSLNSLGATVDLSMRKSSYTYNGVTTPVSPQVLTSEQAAAYTIENVLNGDDSWQPQQSTDQAGAPVIAGLNRTISWDNNNYVLCWGVFKDGNLVQFVTSNSYAIPEIVPEGAVYTVRAANEMGGLSETSNAYTFAITTTSTDHFRSKTTGNSSYVSSWESSSDNLTWISASSVPTVAAASVTILNGHSITLNSNLILSNLTLNSGSTVNINSNIQLTITSSITNNGTMNLLSNASGTATIKTPATINGSGVVSVQQYLTTGRNWYVSSPVSDATSAVFDAASVGNKLYWYDEANGNTAPWAEITNNSTGLSVMKGYVANMAADGVVTFSGLLNSGEKSITVYRTSGQTKGGFNLVGNPYASYLDWNMVTKSNLSTSIWQRTKKLDNTAYVFDTYNASGQIGVDNSGKRINKNIPPMQAFWVRVNEGYASGTLNVDNTMRSHQGNQTINVNQEVNDPVFKAPSARQQMIIRLQIFNNQFSDEAIIYTHNQAQNIFDQYDSPKMFSNVTGMAELYSMINGEPFAINGFTQFPENTEIPVGIKVNAVGDYMLRITQMQGVDGELYLQEKTETGILSTKITEGTTYPVSFKSVDSNNQNLSLVYKAPKTTTSVDNSDFDNYLVYTRNRELIVNGVSGNHITLQVMNLAGQILHSHSLNANNSLTGIRLSQGVYFVRINNNSQQFNYKITVE